MSGVAAVLMAGGLGTRLWPWSTREHPKQFLPLLEERSLVRITYDRIKTLIPPEKTLLFTNTHLVQLAREQLSEIPGENFIGESRSCNTGPCVALAAAYIERLFGDDTVMVILSADHFVGDEEGFRLSLKTAIHQALSEECLVLLGIIPTRPETGYGYLECGIRLGDLPDGQATPLLGFREKPDQALASQYLSGGKHLWNMGNFIWQTRVLLKQMNQKQPGLVAIARETAASIFTGNQDAVGRYYESMPKEYCNSIDYLLLEEATDLWVVPCRVPWDDVGSWAVLRRLRQNELDSEGNLALIRHLNVQSKNITVSGVESEQGLVVTVGVEGLVIVRDGEKVLVASENSLDLMREVVIRIRAEGWDKFL